MLFEVAEAVRVAAELLLPVMPASAAEILRRVGDATPPADVRLDRDGGWRNEGERATVKPARRCGRATDLASADTPAQVTTTKENDCGRDRQPGAAGAGRRHCAGGAAPGASCGATPADDAASPSTTS